jgi:hypothetical protein
MVPTPCSPVPTDPSDDHHAAAPLVFRQRHGRRFPVTDRYLAALAAQRGRGAIGTPKPLADLVPTFDEVDHAADRFPGGAA